MTRFKPRLLTVLSLLVLFLSISSAVLAASPESFGLVPQKTLPGATFYNFKRTREKITEFFRFSKDAKFSYREELLEKRMSEYVSLVENKNQTEIANASQRIAYEAGILTNIAGNSKEKRVRVISLFDKYKPILGKMRDNFPANTPPWLLSQQDIDTMNILSQKLK